MSIIYKNGAIINNTTMDKKVYYDVANNSMTAQFDGQGAISKYAIVNKWSVFDRYFSLYSINGTLLDYSEVKNVTMIGKTQIIEFSKCGADIIIKQFLDAKTNAIFIKITISAKEDIEFINVVNYGVDMLSYLQRFKPKYIFNVISGGLKIATKKNIKIEKNNEYGIIRNNIMGNFYIDIAGTNLVPMEKTSLYVNQFKLSQSVKKGDKKIVKCIISSGTRNDISFADVDLLYNRLDECEFDSEQYIDSIPYPDEFKKDEFYKAFFGSTYNCAMSNYKEVGQFKGFLAGIVYQFPARTYFRDGYWTILPMLKSRPDLVRNEILTLSRGIDPKGKCPSAVKSTFKNYWGDHYDSPSFFVIMVYDYLIATNDKSILSDRLKGGKTVVECIKLVLDRLSNECDATGLLVKGGEYNRRDWCDNVFRSGYVTYDEVLFARALQCAKEIYQALCNEELAKQFNERYENVKNKINEILWDEKLGYYVNYKSEDFVEDNLSIDTVVAVLYGIADEEKSLSVLKNMENMLESRNNKVQTQGDFGVLSVYPFYKQPEHIVQKSSLPYYYHNGGDWPYLSSAYAYAKLMYGMDYIYPMTRWFTYNIEKGNFTPIEFFSPAHKDGSLLQAWSAMPAFIMSYPQGDFFKKKLKI